MTAAKRLAQMVRAKREMQRMTMKDVAKVTGVSAPTVCRVERGDKSADAETVYALCRWLGVSVEYALSGREARETCSRCARTETVLAMVRADLKALDEA